MCSLESEPTCNKRMESGTSFAFTQERNIPSLFVHIHHEDRHKHHPTPTSIRGPHGRLILQGGRALSRLKQSSDRQQSQARNDLENSVTFKMTSALPMTKANTTK